MRARLALTVLAVTTMVMIAFLLPLAVLVRVVAADRALSSAEQEARYLEGVLAVVSDRASLTVLLDQVNAGSPRTATVWLGDGTRLGAATAPPADELALARSGRAFTTAGSSSRRVWVPVRQQNGTMTVAAVTVPASQLQRGVVRAWAVLGGLGLVLVFLAVVVADRLARTIVVPIEDLGEVTRRLQQGDLAARVEPRGPPEVVNVGHAVNQLAGRIGELIAAEREAAADISHRLRTPLTALQLEAEGLVAPDERLRMTAAVHELTEAVTTVIREARQPQEARASAPADLCETVRSRMAFWSVLAEDQGRRWSIDVPPEPRRIGVAREDLAAAVDALLANIFIHTPQGVAFRVAVVAGPADAARLVIDDEGPGFPPGTTPSRGQSGAGSTGLGLDIAKVTAERAGGSMSFGASPTGGARVELIFPGSRTAVVAPARHTGVRR